MSDEDKVGTHEYQYYYDIGDETFMKPVPEEQYIYRHYNDYH